MLLISKRLAISLKDLAPLNDEEKIYLTRCYIPTTNSTRTFTHFVM